MSEQSRITFEELIKGCFIYIENIKAAKSQVSGYLARYVYRHPPNPLGKQVIWLLYHPKSVEPILEELEHVKACCEGWDGQVVLIDDYNPKETSLAFEVALLCDGRFSCDAFTYVFKDGIEGHIGVIVGQGRYIDIEEKGIPELLHMLLANALPLQEDGFIRAGRKELGAFARRVQDHGHRVRQVRIDKHGNVLKPRHRKEA